MMINLLGIIWQFIDVLCFLAAFVFIVWGCFLVCFTLGIFSIGIVLILIGLGTELLSSPDK